MTPLPDLNCCPQQTTIFRCDSRTASAALAAAAAARFVAVSVDLEQAAKPALLERFSVALDFPDWFGGNWDALADCLTDLSWHDAPGYLVVLRGGRSLARQSPQDWQDLGGVLADSTAFWRDEKRPFWVLAENGPDELPQIGSA